jgi:hypothetical protein
MVRAGVRLRGDRRGAPAVGVLGRGQLASAADCARPVSWRSGSGTFGVRADAYTASLILRERR